MRLRRAPVLAGIGFAGILLCALVPEAVAAWMAPALVLGLGAAAMAMRPADSGAGGSADGRDADQGGGEGAGDAGGDGGGDGGE